MRRTVLVTGAEGLVGRALVSALRAGGRDVVSFDLKTPFEGVQADVCDPSALQRAIQGCHGVVHLAAVSRVVWGERDPELCWATNAVGTQNVVDAALAAESRPWVVLSSSREVYGQPAELPVTEQHPVAPLNVYGRAKVAGEQAVLQARQSGLSTAVLRLSNVYGSPEDHADRVIPAFAGAALAGAPLRLEGPDNTFDFTHLDDTIRGVCAVVEALEAGEAELPTLQLVTGAPTSLQQLAALAIELTGSSSRLEQAPARTFDVARFYGSYALAEKVLGWAPRIGVREGLARLVQELRG